MTTAATRSTPSDQPPALPPEGTRLLKGEQCWWVIYGSAIARLPHQAVTEAPGGLMLVPEARTALDDQDFFFIAPTTTYAVTVLTATACNLGCAYCFQNLELPAAGSHAPPRIKNAVLTPELATAVAAFVKSQMTRFSLPDSSLLLFGGEPLLNPAGSLNLLRAMQPLHLADAEIITNGVLLTRTLADELAEAGLRRVQITFDGNRNVHDQIRVTRNGRGTYDKILRNVTAAAESTDLSWHFRVNISHRNLNGLETLIDDLGQAVPPGRTSLHLALIDDVGLGYDNTVGYSAEYIQRFADLHKRAVSHGMFIPVSKPLTTCPYCSVFGGDRGAVVNADGRLYSCWETAGREEWAIGDITDGYLPADTIRDRWVACDFDIKSHGTDAETQQFFEYIDAAALDSMYAHRQGLPQAG
nr:radical SAM protein [Streptomyces sp. NBC_01177]